MRKEGVPGRQSRHLPAFILLFLAENDAHGGYLWTQISGLMPPKWEIDSAGVYRVLRELEERGCVTSVWNTEDAGPAKRVYRITRQGIEELSVWHEDIVLRMRNLEFFVRQYEKLELRNAGNQRS